MNGATLALRGVESFMLRLFLTLTLTVMCLGAAEAPVYVVLWFDTEDYILPAADDAALRLAADLSKAGVRATFKVVGEKARTLEARGREDVIHALAAHDIGYHSNFHSIQPAPAVYLRDAGWLDGGAEFERRESPGVADLRRIFGMTPSCYGQPGSSWGPQSYRALLRMGVPVYLDEGSHVSLDEQPFWFGGMLHVFGMGRFLIRPSIDDESLLPAALAKFDQAAAELRKRGGGVISTYYHPTEFVATEFWDAVNFSKGASRPRSEWKMPRRRTAESSERAYRILMRYVEHAKSRPGVEFVTARELLRLYERQSKPASRDAIVEHMRARLTYLATPAGSLSAAEMLQSLLGMEPREIEGPLGRRASTYQGPDPQGADLETAKSDVRAFIEANRRLPSEVWFGSTYLSIADFARLLAGGLAAGRPRGAIEAEKHISSDSTKTFSWAIHPEGFSAPNLLELARLQAWTLKPAILKKR